MAILISVIFFIISLASLVSFKVVFNIEAFFVILNLLLYTIATRTIKDFLKIVSFYAKDSEQLNFKKSFIILKKYKRFTLLIGLAGSLLKFIYCARFLRYSEVYFTGIHYSLTPLLTALVVIIVLFILESYIQMQEK